MKQLISQKTLNELEKVREKKEAQTLQMIERAYQRESQKRLLNITASSKSLELKTSDL